MVLIDWDYKKINGQILSTVRAEKYLFLPVFRKNVYPNFEGKLYLLLQYSFYWSNFWYKCSLWYLGTVWQIFDILIFCVFMWRERCKNVHFLAKYADFAKKWTFLHLSRPVKIRKIKISRIAQVQSFTISQGTFIPKIGPIGPILKKE